MLAGSTRLTAGTTQKIVLNALSTAAMIHLGKAYGPLDGRRPRDEREAAPARRCASSPRRRQVDEATAQRALDAAGGHAKTAIVALVAGVGAAQARERLARAGGRVRAAIREPA